MLDPWKVRIPLHWRLNIAEGAWGPQASHVCGRESARAGPRGRTVAAGAVFLSPQRFCLLRALRRAVHSDIAPVLSVL